MNPSQLNKNYPLLHVINDLSMGGAELLLNNTLQLLPNHQHIVVYLFPKGDIENSFRLANTELICLHHKGWRSLFSSARKLKKIIKNRKPILVHSHLFYATICSRIAAPSSVPLVSTLHSLYSIDAFKKNRKALWAEKLTLKKRHKLIGVSLYVLEDYLKFVRFKGERFVLHNFLPGHFFDLSQPKLSSGRRDFRCVAVGNLKEVKNYGYLLEIFLHLKNLGITLDIYGEGTLKKGLQEKIDKDDLPVTLRGMVKETKPLFKNYDLFVQASSHEGFGLSVIEAMASGLPVFISDIPVFHEITDDFAHFFPLTDGQRAAKLLCDLKDDKQKREQHIGDGYRYCLRTYNEQAYKNKLLEIYDHILS
jgi:glycosyltransferase involved in cell wall biosynthesis